MDATNTYGSLNIGGVRRSLRIEKKELEEYDIDVDEIRAPVNIYANGVLITRDGVPVKCTRKKRPSTPVL